MEAVLAATATSLCIVLIALATTGCAAQFGNSSTAGTSESPKLWPMRARSSSTSFPGAQETAPATPLAEAGNLPLLEPVIVLDVPLGGSADQPGVSPPRVGGVSGAGPTSFAVGDDGSVFILDTVRGKLLAYAPGPAPASPRVVDLPFLTSDARELLAVEGAAYVRDRGLLPGSGITEYQIGANGAILQVMQTGVPEATAGSLTLYPRPRSTPVMHGKGDLDFGQDRVGNTYVDIVGDPSEVQRLNPQGQVLARARRVNAVDWFLTPAGGLYALDVPWEGGVKPVRAVVYRVLDEISAEAMGPGPVTGVPAAKGAAAGKPEPGAGTPAKAPTGTFQAAGLGLPVKVVVERQGRQPFEMSDPVSLNNLWKILSAARREEEPDAAKGTALTKWFTTYTTATGTGTGTGTGTEAPGEPGQKVEFYRREATSLGLLHLGIGGPTYRVPESILEALLNAAANTPAALAARVRSGPVTLAISDLPGVSRRLTAAEAEQLAQVIEKGWRAGIFEPPQPLERPFPQYAITIKDGGAETHLALAGDGFLYMMSPRSLTPPGPDPIVGYGSEPGVFASPYGAEVSLGCGEALDRLVREWLPVPAAAAGDVARLYAATKLEIDTGAQTQDLTRWKNSVVRALVGARPYWSGLTYPAHTKVTLRFWFTADASGTPDTVMVDAGGFTYAGRRYARQNLLMMMGSMGVP